MIKSRELVPPLPPHLQVADLQGVGCLVQHSKAVPGDEHCGCTQATFGLLHSMGGGRTWPAAKIMLGQRQRGWGRVAGVYGR